MDLINKDNIQKLIYYPPFEETLARVGHVNRVIEQINDLKTGANEHILVGSWDYSDFSSWTKLDDNGAPITSPTDPYKGFTKLVVGAKPDGKRLIDAYVVGTTPPVNNAFDVFYNNFIGTITYSNIAGGVFNIGDTVTSDNGSVGTVVAVSPTVLTLNVDLPNNAWDDPAATTIDNGAGVTADIDYTLSNTRFLPGQIITADNGATGKIIIDYSGALDFNKLSGDWSAATTFSNTLGNTCDITFFEGNNSFFTRGVFSGFGGQHPPINGQDQFSNKIGKLQQFLCNHVIVPTLIYYWNTVVIFSSRICIGISYGPHNLCQELLVLDLSNRNGC
jgi:hypothetical protein